MLPYLNPPASAEDAIPPGNLSVYIVWPLGNSDVDLWVVGPGEIRPVGYSNKSGKLWNLLRDDLGDDFADANFENSYTRGLPAGEYIINIHCYKCQGFTPIVVKTEITIKKEDTIVPVAKVINTLTFTGDEQTVLRFYVNKKGEVIRETMRNHYTPLRAMIPERRGPYGN